MRRNGKVTHRSGVVIARLLGVEGYDGAAHQAVESYWKTFVMDKERAKNITKIEEKFSKLVLDLEMDEKDRQILGRFISLRSQMSFDAGLRVGITAFAHVTDKPVDILSGGY